MYKQKINADKLRYYDGFLGLDLSSDPTRINPRRFPILKNMYKDYRGSGGNAIETVCGFRKRIIFPNAADKLYGMYFYKKTVSGEERTMPLLHVGTKLYLWDCYPLPLNVPESAVVYGDGTDKVTLPKSVTSIISAKENGFSLTFSLGVGGRTVTLSKTIEAGAEVEICFYEKTLTEADALYGGMSESESAFFPFGSYVYILDGVDYLVFNGETVSRVAPYVPTTVRGNLQDGVQSPADLMGEERNILTPKFKNTFVANGTQKKFYMSEKGLTSDSVTVKVYGVEIAPSAFTLDRENGLITFATAPASPENSGYDAGYAGVEIEAEKQKTLSFSTIAGCRYVAEFDNRIFFAGNPTAKNVLFFSELRAPNYVSEVDYIVEDEGGGAICGLLNVGSELAVFLKGGASGSVMYHYAESTSDDLVTKIYLRRVGTARVETVAKPVSFIDEAVLLTTDGLFEILSADYNYERKLGHKSTLVDAELLAENLATAKMAVFENYLFLLVGGKIYLANSRERMKNDAGVLEYEWFLLCDIGTFDGQYDRYDYADSLPSYLLGEDVKLYGEKAERAANYPKADGTAEYAVTKRTKTVDGVTHEYHTVTVPSRVVSGLNAGEFTYDTVNDVYLVVRRDEQTGGVFNAADSIYANSDTVFFGNTGNLLSFNFDKREGSGFPSDVYEFDGRAIECELVTVFDNCGEPDRLKRTKRKSLVIKCKTLPRSVVKVKVRTDKSNFRKIAELNNGWFSFKETDFARLTFNTFDQQIFMADEGEKGWSEKQLALYSDAIHSPFSVYFISYRYEPYGKIKNR